MVGACKEKFRAAGDGAELADDEPVPVNWIVVEDVVFFKINGIIYEVIVHCIDPDGNVGPFDNGLQIDGLSNREGNSRIKCLKR